MSALRVLRVFHGGRDAASRERDRALVAAGVELTLLVPAAWPEPGDDSAELRREAFEVVELPVRRAGDVNRHRFADTAAVGRLVARVRPDVVDLHQEPFSAVVHQVLRALPDRQPVVGYTAQNLDKRFPPPFARWEVDALARWRGLYPCSRQAASVAVGKGFTGPVRVLPLAAGAAFTVGDQHLPAPTLQLLLAGRFVAWKGVLDAVRVAARLARTMPVRLTLVGDGPLATRARELAADLGVDLLVVGWLPAQELAQRCRRAHVVLVPSVANGTWVEQFGRTVVEAQACGAVVAGYASGALPEIVGAAGVLVAEGDVEALAAAVARVVGDPARWAALRSAGLAAAPRWDAVAEGMLELYGAALAGAPSPRRTDRTGRARPRRTEARAVYGPPAGPVGRVFALPLLRADNPATRALAAAIDAVARAEAPPAGDRLRVVYLDHVARLSGGEIALLRLIEALPGVDAHVILGEDGPLRTRLVAAGASVEVLALRPVARDAGRHLAPAAAAVRAGPATAAYSLRLARRLRELRPDLVHVNSLKSGYYGCPAARLARVPVLWQLRDRLAADYLPERPAALTRALLRRLPDLVVHNSLETQRCAGVAGPVVPDPYRRRHVADRPHGGLVAGMVGRIAPWKGQDVLLRAAALVPDLQVRIVGAPLFGEEAVLTDLHKLASDLGVADRVEFAGFCADVETELAAVDVLVHASTVPEPFGQVVVEGMAAGRAVIAADAGGPREVVTDGVDGLLVTPGDPVALAAALGRLRDPALRDRLGTAGRVRARDFEPEVVAPLMLAAYAAVLPLTRAAVPRAARRRPGWPPRATAGPAPR